MSNDQMVRLRALELAISTTGGFLQAETLERAELFYAFAQGEWRDMWAKGPTAPASNYTGTTP